jgi:hypothetical protein
MTEPRPIAIYVDADACPVKAEIYRVAERHILKGDGLKVLVVSNSPIAVPREPWIERVVVGAGMDAADNWIAERAGAGDIIITADVPLASRGVRRAPPSSPRTASHSTRIRSACISRPGTCCMSCVARAKSPAAPGRSRRATARNSSRHSTRRSCGSSAKIRRGDVHVSLNAASRAAADRPARIDAPRPLRKIAMFKTGATPCDSSAVHQKFCSSILSA